MKSVLRELFREIDAVLIDESTEPDAKVTHCDRIVGKCSDETKKIYILREKVSQENREIASQMLLLVAQAIKQLPPPPPPAEFEQMQNKSSRLCIKEKFLGELFWYSLRQEFPQLFDRASIGIRKGWKVVWTDQENEAENFMSFIDELKKSVSGELNKEKLN